MSMNRKGHIPTILLFVEGFVLMLVAWYVFLSFNGKLEVQSHAYEQITQDIAYQRGYLDELLPRLVSQSILRSSNTNTENDVRSHLVSLSEHVDNVSEISGNFFGKLRNADFTITNEGGVYVLTIKDVFITAQSGADKMNEIKQTFDMTVRFSSSGVVR